MLRLKKKITVMIEIKSLHQDRVFY